MSFARQTSSRHFTVRPLPSGFGAEILGVDLSSQTSDAFFNDIYDLFLQYQVLVIRDQSLPAERQLEFGRHFGELHVHVLNQFHHSQHPELYLLSNLDKDGKPDGRHPDPGTMYWHTDGSWTQCRTVATMLYSIEVPHRGGETQLADMYRACDALTEDMKSRLVSLKAVHHLKFHKQRRDPTPLTAEQIKNSPPIEHTVLRIHPETGRNTVYLGDMAEFIQGMGYDEGRALIEELNALITRPEFVYSHKWTAGELVLWDNRCTLHRSIPYDTSSERRVMRRLTVLDGKPR